mmetsp:Transcript_21408/g.24875  ORF Transcript_21408/g.24875 Transcript_21408/m.24875 type:complete len:134 (+) Transcript_21408:72-473(+)|eukprot:CAMPEP_0176432884 /NCGR_PEP_ID=MMETSP0127-20121128/15659_1 /TAXON_ID=938130 /ORGANISM="Platyophrya macrostoma, Strain WH" /LENGTH=133 /DNA_ID=CAMNT_0017815139 /DNA_START=56 /DNA_END=457 /DNA_ORIENTATION=+
MVEPTRTLKKPHFIKCEKIGPGEHGYNVYLKVVSVKHSTTTKADGKDLKIAEAVCGDETACVNVRAIGDNADFFKEGDIISIRNGRSEVFKEKMRLEIDRWGKVIREPAAKIDKVNQDKNLSATSYEVKVVRK